MHLIVAKNQCVACEGTLVFATNHDQGASPSHAAPWLVEHGDAAVCADCECKHIFTVDDAGKWGLDPQPTALAKPFEPSAHNYVITVSFDRCRSDDGEQTGTFHPDALIAQFKKELQAAYDHPDVAMAGHFRVTGFQF